MNDNPCVSVKNVTGSGKHPTSQEGEVWKNHWKKHSSLDWPDKCQCCGKEPAEVGGHVTIIGSNNSQYILPMCSSCNGKRGEEFRNIRKKYLVPVNLEKIYT